MQATIEAFFRDVPKKISLLTEEPLIITKGDTGAVLVPLNVFNAMQRRLEILGNSALMKDIREATLQMAAGQLIEITDIDAL